MMKITALLTCTLMYFTGLSQIKIFVNGSEIKQETIISLDTIEKVEVSFVPTFEVDTYTNGYGYYSIQHFDTEKESVSTEIAKYFEGASACDNWMKSQKKFLMYEKATKKNDFTINGALYEIWERAQYNRKTNLLGVKVIAGYRDKIGYEEYGSHVDLAPEFLFQINTVEDPLKLYTPFSSAYLNSQTAIDLKFEKSYSTSCSLVEDAVFKSSENSYTMFKAEKSSYYFLQGYVIQPSVSCDEQIELIKSNLIEEAIYNTQRVRPQNPLTKYMATEKNNSQTVQWHKLTGDLILSIHAFKNKKQIVETDFYEEITLGQLKGIRLLFAYKDDNRNTHNSFYLFKDPKNPNSVLIFSGIHEKYITAETFKKDVDYIERVLAALQF